MSRELPFLVYCIEEYKEQKNLSGKEVMALFVKHRVCEYIYRQYEILHINGPRYIVQDLDDYMARSV
jgi:hypothetical protein